MPCSPAIIPKSFLPMTQSHTACEEGAREFQPGLKVACCQRAWEWREASSALCTQIPRASDSKAALPASLARPRSGVLRAGEKEG